MKKVKAVGKYILIFIAVIAILLVSFVFVASIPKKYVENNLVEAVKFFRKNTMEVKFVNKEYANTWLYPYDDQIYLNIIHCMDEDKPLESVMECEYYTLSEEDGGNSKYINLIEKNLKPNNYYLRYWHGSIIFVKVFLMIMTLEQIYILNVLILSVLLSILIFILIKNKYWTILISFIIGLIMTTSWFAPFSIVYTAMYALMLSACIFSIIMENKKVGNDKLHKLFFIIGILTCFFDFLTMELLTILVPILMILTIRIKKNDSFKFKEELIFVIKSIVLWLIGYAMTYIVKWILALIILDIDVMKYIKNAALKRVNGPVSIYSTTEIMLLGIKKNIITLFPLTKIIRSRVDYTIPISFAVSSLILLLDIKNKEKRNFLILNLMIAVIPYFRYIILSNHSYLHYFFTFRNQMATVMSVVLIIANCLNKNKLFLEIKIKKNKT